MIYQKKFLMFVLKMVLTILRGGVIIKVQKR